MKLTDLLINQKVIVQLLWGEQKIEFHSEVVISNGATVMVTPYVHNGQVLELNVTQGKSVVCNLFADDPSTRQRISWKGIELTTVPIDGKILYCLKTYGFNSVANQDDRRHNERIVIDVPGQLYDGSPENIVNITVHDISNVGVSFYIPASFAPKSAEFVVAFADNIEDKTFDVKVHCAVSRIVNNDGNATVGCKLAGDNKDYLLYVFIKHLKEKKH